jgi:hypothetical protein
MEHRKEEKIKERVRTNNLEPAAGTVNEEFCDSQQLLTNCLLHFSGKQLGEDAV